MALPRAARIELTEVHATITAPDAVTMAPFNKDDWRETAREEHTTPDGLRYSYVTLVRR